MESLRRTSATLLAALLFVVTGARGQPDSAVSEERRDGQFEFFPILSYDTDVGLGYGGKFFAVDKLGGNESFDLTLFNSSRGERWYRLVISLPDLERRQGTEYPFALDLLIDYDKLIAASFFGVGPESRYSNREYYTKEPLEVSVTCSRGPTPYLVVQSGIRVRTVRNYGFSSDSRLQELPPALNSARATAYSLFAIVRLDTRDSYINARRGEVAQFECEGSPRFRGSDVSFTRFRGVAQIYRPLVGQLVFAARADLSLLAGSDLPVQMLVPIGGGSTLRASPQDRFLGMAGMVANIEFRFPVFWRFGGVVGADAGHVWDRAGAMGLSGFHANGVAGLRFFMDTFVVRLDVGVGGESTGLYLNFGQVF